MSEPREFWLDPMTGKNECTPWENNPVKYKSYNCVDLPGGFWPSRAMHLIEYSAFEKLRKENDELIEALKADDESLNANLTVDEMAKVHRSIGKTRELLTKLKGEG